MQQLTKTANSWGWVMHSVSLSPHRRIHCICEQHMGCYSVNKTLGLYIVNKLDIPSKPTFHHPTYDIPEYFQLTFTRRISFRYLCDDCFRFIGFLFFHSPAKKTTLPSHWIYPYNSNIHRQRWPCEQWGFFVYSTTEHMEAIHWINVWRTCL